MSASASCAFGSTVGAPRLKGFSPFFKKTPIAAAATVPVAMGGKEGAADGAGEAEGLA